MWAVNLSETILRPIPGARPSELKELTRVQDRLSFLYVEHCIVERDANAITFTDDRGTVHIPSAALSVLLLGPGTNVTHQAMVLIADSGSTAIWVGEQGVRMYASGRSMARSSRLVVEQARLVSNRSLRLQVAREMYQMRFNEDVSSLTMQQLRGREGARVRATYRKYSKLYKVDWDKRDYDPNDFYDSNDINQALSAANACLYGLVPSVVVALGCSPALGFVHTGHDLSFVYDIADLYKAETTIPISFSIVSEKQRLEKTESDSGLFSEHFLEDLTAKIRHRMRDTFKETQLITKCVKDIKHLFDTSGENNVEDLEEIEVLSLWDEKVGSVQAGKSYSPDYEDMEPPF